MASKMYVDQLKDVLVHSTSKKVAGFIAEPIQVRTVCAEENQKLFGSIHDVFNLPFRVLAVQFTFPRDF